MILDLKTVMTSEGMETDEEITIGLTAFSSRLGSFPITKKQPFTLHIANSDGKRLLLSGETSVAMTLPCDRCLTDVTVTVPLSFDKVIRMDEAETEEESEEEEDYLEGTSLDTDKLVFHELLLNRPTKVLCRPDCKGICPKCGCNRNETTCTCDTTVLDPRMAAFQDVFQNRDK